MVARARNKLTARGVKAAKEDGWYGDGAGLWLRVARGGASRLWVFVFRWQGARKEMGLGPVADVDLTEAREAAAAARKLVRASVNPIDARREQKATAALHSSVPTFGDVAEGLISDLEPGWRGTKSVGQWRNTLNVHAASLKNKPVDRVRTGDVLAVLKPLWTAKPVTAGKLRGRVERVLDVAKVKGFREGENPARWRGHLALLLPDQPKLVRGHHKAMPWADIPAFMAELRTKDLGAPTALELLILSASRTTEVLGATWAEVDEAAALWTIPAGRMKENREHVVPLTPRALELLAAMKPFAREDGFVFPGQRKGKPLSSGALERVLDRMGQGGWEGGRGYTVHGFRSTFRDWAGDRSSFQREVIEAALSHMVGDAAEQAYRRSTALAKRRKLMEAWAGFLASTPVFSSAVVSLRGR